MAIRNIMGNKEVITILHRLGYMVSYDKLIDFEKDLVSKYHGMQQNSFVLPATIEKYYFSTFVWDNNDLCEETLSGLGTTHVINGIVMQQWVRPSAFPIQIENMLMNLHLSHLFIVQCILYVCKG